MTLNWPKQAPTEQEKVQPAKNKQKPADLVDLVQEVKGATTSKGKQVDTSEVKHIATSEEKQVAIYEVKQVPSSNVRHIDTSEVKHIATIC